MKNLDVAAEIARHEAYIEFVLSSAKDLPARLIAFFKRKFPHIWRKLKKMGVIKSYAPKRMLKYRLSATHPARKALGLAGKSTCFIVTKTVDFGFEQEDPFVAQAREALEKSR